MTAPPKKKFTETYRFGKTYCIWEKVCEYDQRSWDEIIQVGPPCHHKCPYERGREIRHSQKTGDMTVKEEISDTAKYHERLAATGNYRDKKNGLPENPEEALP